MPLNVKGWSSDPADTMYLQRSALLAGDDPLAVTTSTPLSCDAFRGEDPGEVFFGKDPDGIKLKQEDDQLGLVVTACFSLQQYPVEDWACSVGDATDLDLQPEEGPVDGDDPLAVTASSPLFSDAFRVEDPGEVFFGKSPEDIKLKQEAGQRGLVVTECFALQLKQFPVDDASCSVGDAERGAPQLIVKGSADGEVKREQPDGDVKEPDGQNNDEADQKDLKVLRKKGGFKKYTCSECNREFRFPSALLRHMLVHSVGSFECDICKKCFKRADLLKSHKKVHTAGSVKPFICDLCKKRFVHKGHIVRHMRIHTGEKPYICEICKKGCSQKESLVKHLRIHTGEKPYK
ncbi:zinc finger protein 34-like [Frankliniella occidentalis]|uniref:Zinc finger protein 34-like n=1 Tax=Frankliniella occidentalis TaxID=133901 RepID=A0A9C6XWM8_FRAOC|nr:zinc finger protein 34-like [Frankliniella occidentalis]XP_052133603.1 zinc finger protein 34-like [Frankliniella occidentalis]